MRSRLYFEEEDAMFSTTISGFFVMAILMITAISCAPPKQSDSLMTLSQEEFKELTESEDYYGYRGSGNIRGTLELGTVNLDLNLWPVTINTSSGSIKIAGFVVDRATREPLPYAEVAIGKVGYYKGNPRRIFAKKGVITGVDGEFVFEANLVEDDRLFVACMTYVVTVYDVYKLIDIRK